MKGLHVILRNKRISTDLSRKRQYSCQQPPESEPNGAVCNLTGTFPERISEDINNGAKSIDTSQLNVAMNTVELGDLLDRYPYVSPRQINVDES